MSDAPQQPGSHAPAKPAGVSLAALIWIGVAVVVLSFVASFLGATLARSAGEPEATPTPTPSETTDYAALLSEILPSGASVRAGVGAPVSGQGYEGNVYIDVTTADMFVFREGEWQYAGNIREEAAENLAGEPGAPGAPGPTGAPGESGTQVLLGLGAPADDTCVTDGDLYIDTEQLLFYECTGGAWALHGPTPSPSPTP